MKNIQALRDSITKLIEDPTYVEVKDKLESARSVLASIKIKDESNDSYKAAFVAASKAKAEGLTKEEYDKLLEEAEVDMDEDAVKGKDEAFEN